MKKVLKFGASIRGLLYFFISIKMVPYFYQVADGNKVTEISGANKLRYFKRCLKIYFFHGLGIQKF
jgi:hypothetical protein